MYLTQIRLNLSHPLARADAADPYQMHSTLARLMSESDEVAPSAFLWRQEATGPQSCVVLIQSADALRDSRLDENRRGWAAGIQAKTFDVPALVQAGSRYRFRLRANPSVCREGKRHALLREPEQLAWLNRQAERAGFLVESAMISQAGRLIGQRRKGDRSVVVYGVLYDGALQVTDASAVANAIEQGIGRAKHMGLGLLSVAPLRA